LKNTPRSAAKRPFSFFSLILGFFTLVLLILGIVFTVLGFQDYSGHSGRAEAVVTDVVREVHQDSDDRRERVDIDVYVSYRVDGTDYTDVRLNGLNTDEHGEGESLTVAYAPEDPGAPVTVQSTEEGSMDVFRYVGIGLLALAVATGAGAVAVLVRAVRAARG